MLPRHQLVSLFPHESTQFELTLKLFLAVSYFAEMGTAEHILDCISKAELLGETTEEAYNRMEKLASLARSQTTDIGSTSRKVKRFSGDLGSGPRANIITQFKLLLKRSLRENFRGKAKLLIQTVQQVSLGLIYGGIYSIGSNQVRTSSIITIFIALQLSHSYWTQTGFHSRSFWNSVLDSNWCFQHGSGVHDPCVS